MNKKYLWTQTILSLGLICGGVYLINPAATMIVLGSLLWVDLTISIIKRKTP